MKTVIIVGAGIKGLYVAKLLHEQGLRVIVMEKTDRLGGKVKTVSSPCGAITEMGAMRFLQSHTTLRALLAELQIETTTFVEDNDSCPFAIGTQHGTSQQLNLATLVSAGLLSEETYRMMGLPPHTDFPSVLKHVFQRNYQAKDDECTVLEYFESVSRQDNPTDWALRQE